MRRGEDMNWIEAITVGLSLVIAAVGGFMVSRGTAHKIHAEAGKTSAEGRAVELGAQSDIDAKEITALGEIITRLEASYKTLSEQSAADISSLRARLEHSNSDWQDLNARLEQIEGERAALFENSRRLQDDLVAARSEVKRLTQRVVELETDRATDRSEIARKNAELEAKNKQIAEYQERLAVAIQELDRERKGVRGL